MTGEYTVPLKSPKKTSREVQVTLESIIGRWDLEAKSLDWENGSQILERHYLCAFKGLDPTFNRWISESKILETRCPTIRKQVEDFNARFPKEKVKSGIFQILDKEGMYILDFDLENANIPKAPRVRLVE